MRRRRTLWMVLAVVLALVLGLLLAFGLAGTGRQGAATRLSVVLWEGSGDRWTSLTLGMRQACTRLGIETPVAVLAGAEDPARQIALIERELEGRTDGMIVAAATSDDALADTLAQAARALPVVVVQNGAGTQADVLAADDALIGRTLAGGLAAQEAEVVVLAEGLHRQNVRRRYDAFVAEMEQRGIPVTVWERGGMPLADFIAGQLRGKLPRAIVAFDTETLEAAIDAATAIDALPRLYGVGSSDKILHQLDRQLVREICFVDEYSLGYLAVMRVAEQLGFETPALAGEIDVFLVRQDNLYAPEVERMLFPIIQ